MSKLPTTRKKNKKPVEHFNKVSTTERQWLVLSMIQRSKWIGTVFIQEQLRLAGFNVSLRTVQRDLVALSERFLLEHNNSNPQGWRWRDDAPLQSMPNMNLSQAVAFRMVKENLVQLLPPAILKELHPWFDLADQQLKEENTMQSWLEKVHIEPPTLSLIPPEINTHVQNTIYQAVFEHKQLQASYTSVARNQATDYILNPLALVQRGAIIYLLATKAQQPSPSIDELAADKLTNNQTKSSHDIHGENGDNGDVNDNSHNNKHNNKHIKDTNNDLTITTDENIRMFSLHRFANVELLEEAAVIPNEFSLKKFIDSGAMGFQEKRFDDLPNRGKRTEIKLTFDMQAYRALSESKLSEDQVLSLNYSDNSYANTDTDKTNNSNKDLSSLTQLDNDNPNSKVAESFNVTATVNLTRQLVWWLRGFGMTLLNAEPQRLWQVVQDRVDDVE